jgi:hypothetical protein
MVVNGLAVGAHEVDRLLRDAGQYQRSKASVGESVSDRGMDLGHFPHVRSRDAKNTAAELGVEGLRAKRLEANARGGSRLARAHVSRRSETFDRADRAIDRVGARAGQETGDEAARLLG